MVDTFIGNFRGVLERWCIHLTNISKVLTVRVPNEIKAWSKAYDMRKVIESLYELEQIGIIQIIDNEIVIPENEIESERFEDIP